MIIVAGGAYYLGTQNNKTSLTQSPTIAPQNTINASPTSSPTLTLADTTNWKTYTFVRANSTVPRFQVKYPENWDYREVSAGNPLNLDFYTSSIGKLPRQVSDTGPSDDPKLPQPLKAPIGILVSLGEVNRCPCEDITVGGLPAKKIKLEHWEIIELVKNDYTFSIMLSLKDGANADSSLSTEKEIEIFNAVLSTFKFTD